MQKTETLLHRVKHMTLSKEKLTKKNVMIGAAILCLIAILIVVCILGFRDGGWFRGKGKSYDAQYVQSLEDYAKQLEEAGNSEAAAAIYELIAKNGGGDIIRKANDEIQVIRSDNELEQFRRIISGSKAGGGR